MENNENTQMNAAVEAAQANEIQETSTAPAQEQSKQEAPAKRRRSIRLGGTLEQVCMLVLALGIAAETIFDAKWLKITIAAVCAVVFLAPIIIRAFRNRNVLNAEKVCSILRKHGITPVVVGDEIRWSCNGKESVLRIRSHCQVEIAREYDIPSVPAVISGNEKAALETMKEVYLAKVAVREEDGNNKLAFSTESLCVSAKELSAYIPMCLEILDLAESRQREHIAEIRNGSGKGTSRKIGFIHPDGEIR